MSNIISSQKSEVKPLLNSAASFSKELLFSAIQESASDLHFFPTAVQTEIYFRVNSHRTHHRSISRQQYKTLLSYFKFSSGMDIGETRKPQDGTMQVEFEGLTFAIRLSTLPVGQAESLALRILPQSDAPQLEDLFLFPYQMNRLNAWLQQKSGIILLTGATGSGKTTTMYALLRSLLHHRSFQAITLEDPVEQEVPDLLQVQVNEKAGITYDAGLRAALRHDPDVLMVGEIRDRETAKFTFHAGFTGHLLMSTLHAKDTFGTIHRLIEMGISKNDLHQSLIAVASLELLNIQTEKRVSDRGLVLEILDGKTLERAIDGYDPNENTAFVSFDQLRRKAFAYGFVTDEIFAPSPFQISKKYIY